MALYMKNFLFAACACAYVCVCMCVCVRGHVHGHSRVSTLCFCVRGSEVGRAGMYQCVIAVSWLHTVHRVRAHHVYLRGWGGEGTEKELKLSI